MFLSQFLFFTARTPGLVVWDYKNHKQFELDAVYAKRLLQIIEDPSSFDEKNIIDLDLLNNGVFSKQEVVQEYWGWDDLSKIFHLGTKDIPCEAFPKDRDEWAGLYYSHCESLMMNPLSVSVERPVNSIDEHLPDEVLLKTCKASDAKLNEALVNRKTCRVFERKTVSLENFSSILYLAFGYLKERDKDVDEFIPAEFRSRRSSPSGGGLNASEAYIYVGDVESVAPGIYYYNPVKNSLIFMCDSPKFLGEFWKVSILLMIFHSEFF